LDDAETLLPTLIDIVEHHLRGTKFNIHVDLTMACSFKERMATTHLDGREDGDWVVTPRRGKQSRLMRFGLTHSNFSRAGCAKWGTLMRPQRYADHAARARASFNKRFWFEEGGYLYDVVDVDGAARAMRHAGRTNFLRVSLDNPVLQ